MNPDTNLWHQQQELPLPDQLHRQHFQFIDAHLNKTVVGNVVPAAAAATTATTKLAITRLCLHCGNHKKDNYVSEGELNIKRASAFPNVCNVTTITKESNNGHVGERQ